LRHEKVADRRPRLQDEYSPDRGYKFVRLVSAESVEAISVAKLFAKLPKAAQRELLVGVCDKMIDRRVYDEIAAFLIGQLGGTEDVAMMIAAGKLRDPKTIRAELERRRAEVDRIRAERQTQEQQEFETRAQEAVLAALKGDLDLDMLRAEIVAAMRWAQTR
jgi:hypothetical protein